MAGLGAWFRAGLAASAEVPRRLGGTASGGIQGEGGLIRVGSVLLYLRSLGCAHGCGERLASQLTCARQLATTAWRRAARRAPLRSPGARIGTAVEPCALALVL